MKKIFIILLFLSILVYFSACQGKSPSSTTGGIITTNAPTTTQSAAPNTEADLAPTTTGGEKPSSHYPISEFTVIHSAKASKRVESASVSLSSFIKDLTGDNILVRADRISRKEGSLEIVIGNTTREESQITKLLSENEYIISCKNGIVVITATTDDIICDAVNDFKIYIKDIYDQNGGKIMLSDFEIKASAEDLVVSDFSVLYPVNASKSIKTMADSIAKMLEKTCNEEITVSELSGSESDERYKNAIILGGAGIKGEELCSNMAVLDYKIKQYTEKDSVKIYLCGKDDIGVMRAAHYFYAEVYENGELSIPKDMSVSVSTFFQRDPCILLHEGKYYLYANGGNGYSVRSSEDLIEWSAESLIFSAEGSDGIGDFWAPECHFYNGKFYLMATYRSSVNNHRGVAVFRSDTPNGRFELISKRSADANTKGHITPYDWDAIDGTLYVDKNGKPYMVFVHEWTSTDDGIGRMAYAPLSEDLSYFTDEPKEMFRADDPVWTDRQVTDGPWMYRCKDGSLLMIWSNFGAHGYAVTIAKSSNGEIDGEWIQSEKPLFTGDFSNVFSVIEGGHGMMFTSKDGRLYLTIHSPNSGTPSITYIPLFEEDGMLFVDVSENR